MHISIAILARQLQQYPQLPRTVVIDFIIITWFNAIRRYTSKIYPKRFEHDNFSFTLNKVNDHLPSSEK